MTTSYNILVCLFIVFSELTLEQQDQLLLFTLSTEGRKLEKEVCKKLPIVDIIDSMESFVPQKYKVKYLNTYYFYFYK